MKRFLFFFIILLAFVLSGCEETLSDRRIDFENIPNAREFGGLRTYDGNYIRIGKIIRCANLSNASGSDMRRIKDKYKIKKVFDLRNEMEIMQAKDKLPKDMGYTAFDINKNFETFLDTFYENHPDILHPNKNDEFFKLLKPGRFNEDRARYIADYINKGYLDDYSALMYENFITDPEAQKMYAQIFDEILELEGGSFLIHCTQGKDRTGFVIALILSALGLDIEKITQDYLITNEMNFDMISITESACREVGMSGERIHVMKSIMGVDRKVFENAIRFIDDKYGSIMQYLITYINLSDGKIEQLKKYYLE